MSMAPFIVVCRHGGCSDAPWLLWLAIGAGAIVFAVLVWMLVFIYRNRNRYR